RILQPAPALPAAAPGERRSRRSTSSVSEPKSDEWVLARLLRTHRTVSPGRNAGISPRIGSVDGANHWIGSTGSPGKRRACRDSFFRVERESHRLIHRIAHRFRSQYRDSRLEQKPGSAIVLVCFETRKGIEAWNPGNFGCRGLLVYGVRQRAAGSASSSSSRLDRSGSGYLFP